MRRTVVSSTSSTSAADAVVPERPGEAADRLCNRLVDEIDIHHGGTGAGQLPWSEIEVFGAPLTDALRSALEDIGGQTFVPTREGFVCRRTVTYPESKPSDRMED